MLAESTPILLTVIRGFAILKLTKAEKGFHDGDVSGAFFFCRFSLLVLSSPTS